VLVHVVLDIGDVVAPGDVVLARDLLVDHLVTAHRGGVVDRQALLLEQALVHGDEKAGGVDGRDDGHIERGLF